MIFKHSLDPFCSRKSSTYSRCLVSQLLCIFPLFKTHRSAKWKWKAFFSCESWAELKVWAFAAYSICNSCRPEAPSDLSERQKNHRSILENTKLWAVMQGVGPAPSRSTSSCPKVSIILIEFIFADNNCKYNLTNDLTHNILYKKSWLNRLCIINWHIYLWELGDNTYSCHLQ